MLSENEETFVVLEKRTCTNSSAFCDRIAKIPWPCGLPAQQSLQMLRPVS